MLTNNTCVMLLYYCTCDAHVPCMCGVAVAWPKAWHVTVSVIVLSIVLTFWDTTESATRARYYI